MHRYTDFEIIDDVLYRFDTAMLVTHGASGEYHARPMTVARRDLDDYVYLITGRDGGTVQELLQDPHVCLSMQDDHRFLSLSGVAVLDEDRNKIRELWSPAWNTWFPAGPEDESICLIRVRPTMGEYWDVHGTRRLMNLLEAGRALVRGERLKSNGVGIEHARVELS